MKDDLFFRSRAIQPGSAMLTPVRLAHYVNALLACYQNPRDFYAQVRIFYISIYFSKSKHNAYANIDAVIQNDSKDTVIMTARTLS